MNYRPPAAVVASVLACTDRHSLEEPVHTPIDTDLLHDSRDDVSDRRRPNTAEREALNLLGLDQPNPWVRLSLTNWERVDRLVDVLAEARSGGRPVVPSPRLATDLKLSAVTA